MKDPFTRNNKLGTLLRDCRKEVGLKQKELAQKISIDSSMISRFERGKLSPSHKTLQSLINALALEGVPREKLDRMWEIAGYHSTDIFDTATVASPLVVFVQKEFERRTPPEKKLLSEDIRSIIEIDQAYFAAKKHIDQRRLAVATEELLGLKSSLEERIQHWFLRMDAALGKCFFSSGRYGEAIVYYESALLSAREVKESNEEGEILIRLGGVHRRRGGEDWSVAQERYETALKIFEKQKNRTRIADCYRKSSSIYLFKGLPRKALPLCEESLTLSYRIPYIRGIYKGLQHQGWAYDLLGQWQKATQIYEEALDIVKREISDEWELAKAQRYLGDAYRFQRRTKEAEAAYKAALSILEKHENTGVAAKLLMGMIFLGLGKVYLKQPGQELEAKRCLNESLKIHQGLGEDFKIAEVLTEQGDLLLKLGRHKDAELRLKLAIERLKRLGNHFHYAISLNSLCDLYYVKQEWQKVYETAERVKELDEDGLLSYQLSRVKLLVGKALIKEKRYTLSFTAFCRATEKAWAFNEINFQEVQTQIFEAVREVPPDQAIQFYQKYLDCLTRLLKDEDETTKRESLQSFLETTQLKMEECEALEPID